jgi:hypothetical protein
VEFSLRQNMGDLTEISPLAALVKLNKLDLGHSEITDPDGIKALSGLTEMTSLNLEKATKSGSNLSPLAGMTKLTDLNLNSAVASDFTFLSQFHLMKKLDLSFALYLSSIAESANMALLEWLGVRWCGLSDLRPLTHLDKLEWVDIALCRDAENGKPDPAMLQRNTRI